MFLIIIPLNIIYVTTDEPMTCDFCVYTAVSVKVLLKVRFDLIHYGSILYYPSLITLHSLCCPIFPRCFQNPCLLPVWNEEAVVVSETRFIFHAWSSLTVRLQQLCDNTDSFLSRISSLKSEPVELQNHRYEPFIILSQNYTNLTKTKQATKKSKQLKYCICWCLSYIKWFIFCN